MPRVLPFEIAVLQEINTVVGLVVVAVLDLDDVGVADHRNHQILVLLVEVARRVVSEHHVVVEVRHLDSDEPREGDLTVEGAARRPEPLVVEHLSLFSFRQLHGLLPPEGLEHRPRGQVQQGNLLLADERGDQEMERLAEAAARRFVVEVSKRQLERRARVEEVAEDDLDGVRREGHAGLAREDPEREVVMFLDDGDAIDHHCRVRQFALPRGARLDHLLRRRTK